MSWLSLFSSRSKVRLSFLGLHVLRTGARLTPISITGWKRLLLADAPRQVVNALTLYAFGQSQNWTTDVYQYFKGNIFTAGIILTMLFTLFIWTISAVLLLVAAILYVPLLCYIQGNLKEYCCHKADKRYILSFCSEFYPRPNADFHFACTDIRIADLMKRKNRKRLAKEAEIAKKEARGDFSHLKDKKGKFTAAPLPQPTLPQIGLADEDLYAPAYPDSDSGSLRGASMKKSASGEGYAYPPTNGGYQPSWENQYDRSRPAYPNHPSQMDSLHYADSTHSADLAYDVGYGESSLALNDLGHPSRPGMSHAPSYQSRIGDYGYADGRGEQQQQHYDSYGMEKEMYVNGRGGQQYGHEQYDEKEYAYGEEYQRYPSPHDGRSASRQQDRSTHRPTGSQSSYVSQQQSTHPSSSRPDASNRHASQISEASSIAYSNGNGSGHGTSRDGRQGGNDGRSRNR